MKDTHAARICVPVCEPRACDLPQAVARAAEVADIIELRLDCLEDAKLDEIAPDLRSLLDSRSRPVILTFRPAEQGGQRALDDADRCAFLSLSRSGLETDFIDVELDLLLRLIDGAPQGREIPRDWNRIVCSHHDFTGIPFDLEKIYERMASTPARILKIAVQAGEITDCIPVFHLLDRARREGREMIAIAMGNAGAATRILGPSRGAFLTYGSLDPAHATAPGQITAADLRDLYRIHRLDQQTKIMGLVGSPVMHSVSPHIHNAAFAASGINAVYLPFEVRNAHEFMRRMVDPRTREIDWNLCGLSVTAPHKSAVIEHLDWVEPSAREIGAVNTIVVEGDELYGYNTDVAAVLVPLQGMIDTLRDTRVAIIGAGGATRCALWSLRQAGASVTVFARRPESARPLAEKFGASFGSLANASFSSFDVVINATPLGTRGHSENETPAAAGQLRGARLAYDLVYNPRDTRFMREARQAGCESVGGLAMLVAQATEQFKLWTGHDAPADVMREAARRPLEGP